MWINKPKLAWRRREEAAKHHAAAVAAEHRFAAFARAVDLLVANAEGTRWLGRHGITSPWCARTARVGKTGAEGLSVLEGVVLAQTCSHLLDDAALIRWMSRAQSDALQALHAAAVVDVPPGTGSGVR